MPSIHVFIDFQVLAPVQMKLHVVISVRNEVRERIECCLRPPAHRRARCPAARVGAPAANHLPRDGAARDAVVRPRHGGRAPDVAALLRGWLLKFDAGHNVALGRPRETADELVALAVAAKGAA